MHEIVTKKSIWKFTCWIKKRNHLSSKSFIILFLYKQMSNTEQYCYFKTTIKIHDEFKCCYFKTITKKIFDELHCYFKTTILFSDCFRWCATFTIQKKANMLHHNFFLKKSQTDLNDMKNFEYEQAVNLFSQIIKNNILNIMNKQKKFNAFNINKNFNVFFKIMRKLFVKIIMIFI